MPASLSYTIYSISDIALTIDFGTEISEEINLFVLSLYEVFRQHPIPGVLEIVPAYSSLTVYYDLFSLKKTVPVGMTVFDWICGQLTEWLSAGRNITAPPSRTIRIPVCYETEFGPDSHLIMTERNLSLDDLVHLHCARRYRVYMLGFLPGFPYMGEVDEQLATTRKPRPQMVAAGSVGIAGRQTGIYPLASPGGWQIIGRTPLRIFDAEREHPAYLQPGDTVQFYSISRYEFERY